MAVISSPTYDPQTTATNLANSYIAGTKAILDDQSNTATALSSALTSLGSAMSTFQSAIAGLASASNGVTATKATFSNSLIGTATAKSTAVTSNYSFYVEQLATAGQVAYGGITDAAAAGAGALNVTLADGTSFQVNLANADGNHDGVLSAKEIAASVNISAGNNSRVTASTVTVNGASTIVLSSNLTGADNAASFDTSGVTDAGLKAQLDNPANQQQVVTAKDAVVWIGAQNTGTRVQQASNVFNLIDDVTMTFTKAQSPGDNPVTLSVGPDNTGTAANVQTFVDAYNKLNTALDALTTAGNPNAKPPVPAGPMANDSGLLSLRSRMQGALRTVTGGQSLITFGLSAQHDGSLALDSGRMNKAIAANPTALDSLFGRAAVGAESGALGALDTLMAQWTNSAKGQISTRNATIAKQQQDITARQAVLQNQYDNAYKRYLAQFTTLQQLQAQMTGTSNLFTALFTPSSNS
jgi:flagellar hook-associated protein 2